VSTHSARLGLVQISFAGVLWGTGGLGMKIIADHSSLSFLTVSAYRMVVAAVVLAVTVLARRSVAEVRDLLSRHPLRSTLVGLCTGGYQALYFSAVLSVGLTVATVVSLGLAPVLLAVGEAIRLRRRPLPRQTAVVLMALIGLVMVSSTGASAGAHPVRGVAEAVASGTLWALTTAISRGIAASTQPLALVTVATSAGAIMLVPLAFIGGGSFLPPTVAVAAALSYLGVFTMALAYGLLYAGLRSVEASAAVIATLLEPVTAAMAAALLLNEDIGVRGLVGTVAILGAVAALGRNDPEPVAISGAQT